MDIALRTTKGSDPLRPEFGSNIYQYMDTPLDTAIPNIKAEIINTLEMWITNIEVTNVNHSYNSASNPVFQVTYTVLDQSIVDTLLFDLKAGQTTASGASEIILQAFFPPNPNNYRYQVSLIRNSVEGTPLPDAGGYANINDLFNWITTNWFFWGRWYLLSDRIVCYMNSEGINNATLSISVIAVVRIEAQFPPVDPGHFYNVTFNVNGQPVSPAMPQTFNIPGSALFWAQSNWGQYGSWSIEGVSADSNSVFSDEFSDEFDTPLPDTFKLILVSNIADFTGELQIITS